MKGINEWLKKLESIKNEFPKTVERALDDEANEILSEVKKETPTGKYTNPVRFKTRDGKEVSFKVKSIPPGGELRAAWKKEKTGQFIRTIYNNTEYANHVEYGHRIVQGGKTKGRVRGRYMLYKAIRRSNKRLPKVLNTLIKNLLK